MGAEVVWLASYPRSGNTMVRRMIHEITGLPTYSMYPDKRVSEEQRKAMGHVELKWHELCPLMDYGHKMFIKTHENNNAGKIHPAVLIVRDGRDVCVSYARYLEKFSNYDSEGLLERVILGHIPRLLWGDYLLGWQPRGDQPIMSVKYEDILEDPHELLKVLSFAGLEVDKNTEVVLPSIKKLHQQNPKFFHRGGSYWEEVMTKDQIELFWEHHGDAMREFGYA